MPATASKDQGHDRRTLIGRALYRSIRQKGYAQTQLSDIARIAQMSPSHVRYYFDGKQAILEWYFARTCEIFAARTQRLVDSKPADPLLALAESYFPDSPRRRAHLKVFVELRALALHNENLNQQVRRHDREQVQQCAELLTAIPSLQEPGRAHDAAEIAYALAQGLYMAEALERFETDRSRSYFCHTLSRTINA